MFFPRPMVGVMLQRIAECRANEVVRVPDLRETYTARRGNGTVQTIGKTGRGISILPDESPKGKVSFSF